MEYLTSKELYELFLESDWWRDLSYRRRQQSGFKCDRCGKLAPCQAHHKRYPENWFDTQLDDLECLCRECHELAHQIKTVPVEVPMFVRSNYGTIEEAVEARNNHLISREKFLEIRNRLKPRNRRLRRRLNWILKHKKKPSRNQRKQWNSKLCKNHVRRWNTQRKHWVNRGTSSN